MKLTDVESAFSSQLKVGQLYFDLTDFEETVNSDFGLKVEDSTIQLEVFVFRLDCLSSLIASLDLENDLD